MGIIEILEAPTRLLVDSFIKTGKKTGSTSTGGFANAYSGYMRSNGGKKQKRKPLTGYGKDYPNYNQSFFKASKFESSNFKGLTTKKKTIFDIK